MRRLLAVAASVIGLIAVAPSVASADTGCTWYHSATLTGSTLNVRNNVADGPCSGPIHERLTTKLDSTTIASAGWGLPPLDASASRAISTGWHQLSYILDAYTDPGWQINPLPPACQWYPWWQWTGKGIVGHSVHCEYDWTFTSP